MTRRIGRAAGATLSGRAAAARLQRPELLRQQYWLDALALSAGYATSADVTGDTSRVVGYAGMLFG
jgi:predicted class III extradiol MEMO1 family dioxygenase